MTFAVRYEDGTEIKGLTFEEGEALFYEAHGTDNPCTVYPEERDYKPV